MFQAEVTGIAGPKGKHDPERAAARHGSKKGSVTLGGQRVSVTRARARSLDGHEVPLASYAHFASEDLMAQIVIERMLAGVATRRHARTGEQIAGADKSTSKSAILRRFVRQIETALAELMACDLSGEDIKVLMLDGERMAKRCVVVALAISADGTKRPVGLWDGSTENKTGPKGRHDEARTAVRRGRGSVSLGGRRVPVTRPRVRAADGSGELAIASYALFTSTEALGKMAMEKMLAALSTRRYPVSLD